MSDPAFIQHCLELLAPLGASRARRMFGGHALYVDDLCIALVIRDVFYLKVDDAHRAAFEAAHGRPFTYETRAGKRHSLSYYTVPEEAMESPHEMTPWARKALSAAVAARARTLPKKRAPTRPPAKTAGKAVKPAARKRATRRARQRPVPAGRGGAPDTHGDR